MRLEKKLELIKEFQNKYPGSHVGGSIGLFLHGINLIRDYDHSDVDLFIKEELKETIPFENYTDSSDRSDFVYAFRVYGYDKENDALYIKVDIRICPEPEFLIINYKGVDYNVSIKQEIISWKIKYAEKGVQKHINDLLSMGVKFEMTATPVYNFDDDLPF